MPAYHFFTPIESTGLFTPFFFNSDEYLDLFPELNLHRFYLISEKSKKTICRIHFRIENEEATNPAKAPFGGLETSLSDFSTLHFFWHEVEKVLSKLNVRKITVTHWPLSHPKNKELELRHLYLSLGFKVLFEDYNFHYQITPDTAYSSFHRPEKKRLRKCIKAGFVFEKWDNKNVELAYDLLLKFRTSKNIPLNITKEKLKTSFDLFPDRYCLFVTKTDSEVAGLSVCVKVNEEIFYHFCLATDQKYDAYSPSVMLYEGIYHYCQASRYDFFDFGTASIRGLKQVGLFHFKEKLGGIMSLKPTFFKSL